LIQPRSPEELAEFLAECSRASRSIQISGANTKQNMAGPVEPADTAITTSAMTRVLQYEPADLTISVEVGLRWSDLTNLLAGNNQMIPLDPPFFDYATVGGVIAANSSGPRRRLFGTARDVVIGMKFATLEGKLVNSGGMVVKNVAGLDMAKLMIGSFGTLAAIAVVNFKLAPIPATSRTFILSYPDLASAMKMRNRILQGVLQPAAIDLVNPAAAKRFDLEGYCLLLQAGGSETVMQRYVRELAGAEIREDNNLWTQIREFTPNWLRDHPEGAVVRQSTTLQALGEAIDRVKEHPVLARAGNGVMYVYYSEATQAKVDGVKGAIEFSPEPVKRSLPLWPATGSDFAVMQKIKQLFDPQYLLNKGRLYGRI
jgi:glycolate oxidase FAD binding subunit